jgi:hypothetical protein
MGLQTSIPLRQVPLQPHAEAADTARLPAGRYVLTVTAADTRGLQGPAQLKLALSEPGRTALPD